MSHRTPVGRLALILLFLIPSCFSQVPTPAVTPTGSPKPIPSAGTDEPVRMTAEKLAQFEDYALKTMKMAEVPGMSIAIVENGKVIYAKGFGVRELGKAEPVTPDTIMFIASTTKPLTSLMMASIVDDGLMQWDTPVTSILPGFAVGDPDLTQKLTMRDLICACSGIPSRNSPAFLSGLDRGEETLHNLQSTKPVADFGKKFIYSNTMFSAGGYIAALAAGGPKDRLDAGYISAMQERLFNPVGMSKTTFSVEAVETSTNFALPHGKTFEYHYAPMPLSSENFVLSHKPGGALWSTATDLSQLLITLLDQGIAPNGKRIVSLENLERVWQPAVVIGDEEEYSQYALGWFIGKFNGDRLISHGGNGMGFTSDFSLLPEAGLGIVILTNAQGATEFTDAVRGRFLELAFDQPFTHDADFKSKLKESKQDYLEYAKKLKLTLDRELVTPYLGTFFHPEIGRLTLQVENGKLMLHTEGLDAELNQYTGLEGVWFVVIDLPLQTFPLMVFELKTDPDGEPTILLHENGIPEPYIFERLDSPGSM